MSNIDLTPIARAGFEFKSLKTWNGREGTAFQGNLYFGRTKVAEVTDDGWGGELRVEWIGLRYDGSTRKAFDHLEGRKLTAWLKSQKAAVTAHAKLAEIVASTPGVACEWDADKPLTVNAGWLLDEFATFYMLVKDCKKKTCFRRPEDNKTTYSVYNRPFTPSMKTYIDKNHPGSTILNEEVNAILGVAA
jgi:hypothetical protein